jgi:pimeloyl-ACP methyl ester carboxylesterase
MKLLALSCLALCILPTCTPAGRSPDLGAIYSAAAKAKHSERNPIIVIPGLLGSRLVDGDGRVVWGEFGSGAVDLGSPEGRRLLALPMGKAGWPQDELRPDGALERVKVSFGFDFKFEAYASMLRAFGAGGYLDSAHLNPKDVDYGSGHFTCFQFGYDWRRSCAENARLLGRFIEEKRKYVQEERFRRDGKRSEVKFDLVAHSMGGLIGRYYLMYGGRPLTADGAMSPSWEGARHVDRFVVVGTPNDGAIQPLQELREGYKMAPFLPRIDPAVIGTMPSMYELLPPAELAAVIDKDSNPVPVLQMSPWEQMEWGLADPEQDAVLQELLPGVASEAERSAIARGHLSKMLSNARAFHRAMGAGGSPPGGTEIHAFAGDAVPTASRAQLDATGVPKLIAYLPGDGSVTRKSMLKDRRSAAQAGERLLSSIPWTDVNFVSSDHLGMTSDPAFVDNVLHLLLERP